MSDQVTEMKQACLDLSNAAMEMFDLLDADGMEGPWNDPLVAVRMRNAFDAIAEPLGAMAVRRLMALGVNPETILGMK